MAKKTKRKNKTISFYTARGRYMGFSIYSKKGAVSEANNWIRSGNYVVITDKNGKKTTKGKK
tara:strand:- start:2584 stop:2769 length:186 start_codon:yes stop_codon:yes gene_type:complete